MKTIKMVAIVVFLSLFCFSPCFGEDLEAKADQAVELSERALDLKERALSFEREKWEYEKAEKERKEFEEQFPACFDYKRKVPTYELQGYVTDSERRNLVKIFTILLEQGVTEVKLNISSFGGSAFDGLGVANTIEQYKKKGLNIIGHAYGKIASAAVPVFASCSVRITGSSTVFMVHEASIFKFFSSESSSDIDAQKEMMDKLESKYVDILVRNSKMGTEHWVKAMKKETWFTAETAKEWGLVDKIE